ncbi:hypothetical protein FM104_05480 [Microbacterium esteraromaticum]|uniref:Uncharacterized protein n=1 Tax=Microbacterium esteraromaticum TaxID=57043 RepID=A0A1R4J4S0_9MICO|nr:hypothetical protein FM104_05480 [Microbacterium esteraromaticum]
MRCDSGSIGGRARPPNWHSHCVSANRRHRLELAPSVREC